MYHKEAAERYPNIELLSAYIPDPFGTHHSKMLILFRHDDHVQVIIHTANMIHRDWANMTQAVWVSPPLPQTSSRQSESTAFHPIGSGKRFKFDLLRYLGAYGKRLENLTTQLKDYDFSSVRAAFLGSAPSRQKPAAANPSTTAFGWLGLSQILSSVPVRTLEDNSRPHIITQISSVATLGAAPTWLSHFQSILSCCSKTEEIGNEGTTLFTKPKLTKAPTPKFSVVFPTSKEIRMSLDGYASGGSIHWKIQSAQQQKQLEYMHPLLCHWNHISTPLLTSPSSADTSRREAYRSTAAPHIKTYIRFSSEEHTTIDWALVTSANLSKQAWGDMVNKKEEIWIQSWETGVVVWPALYAESEQSSAAHDQAVMIPVFGTDSPGMQEMDQQDMRKEKTVVGFRMPYNVPLVPYSDDEKPWCATLPDLQPDRYGRIWSGYGR
jgi:tyrosyl-DNA phosphodiesterase-1